MSKNITRLLKKRPVFLDGAMGTELIRRGLKPGQLPEIWALKHPRIVMDIHSEYQAHGADIVYTCTFGANRKKLKAYNVSDVAGVNKKLASLAKKAVGNKCLVAGDIGPTGEFIKPFGAIDFDEAVDIFKEQVRGLLKAGVDLFVIETMMDIQEARAALIAVRELTTDAFTIVTLTYEKGERTLNGNDPISSLITLQSLGANAFGCNCSCGPRGMHKLIAMIKPYATIPVVAKPNAGLPRLVDTATVFDMKPDEFVKEAKQLIAAGVNLIGGCCGTSPAHIGALRKTLSACNPKPPKRKSLCAVSSARSFVVFDENKSFTVIGEKINPTGKKSLQQELGDGRFTLVRTLAKEQEALGADCLDVNVAHPSLDEAETMQKALSLLSVVTDRPLVIDSPKQEVIEKALRLYPGRALINSITAEPKKTAYLLNAAKKYGAVFILLPVSAKKIPATFTERKRIITSLIAKAKQRGFTKDDFIVDALVMAISCDSAAACVTLKTVDWLYRVMHCRSVIGLSNISFGMPKRRLINRVFLTMAKKKGLALAIADVQDNVVIHDRLTEAVLNNQAGAGKRFIARYQKERSSIKKKPVRGEISIRERIYQSILEGDREHITLLADKALKAGEHPFKLIQEILIPAIIEVGRLFDKRKYFLPQLILSAETMKKAVAFLNPFLSKHERTQHQKGIILIATVEGDIHDIGKNIVSLLLKNHGFTIVDLGKDISSAKIIRAIERYQPDIVGLSALMTTTMVSMQEVISLARKRRLKCKFMVGGAVITKAYADTLGAQYAKDGVMAVRVAEKLLQK